MTLSLCQSSTNLNNISFSKVLQLCTIITCSMGAPQKTLATRLSTEYSRFHVFLKLTIEPGVSMDAAYLYIVSWNSLPSNLFVNLLIKDKEVRVSQAVSLATEDSIIKSSHQQLYGSWSFGFGSIGCSQRDCKGSGSIAVQLVEMIRYSLPLRRKYCRWNWCRFRQMCLLMRWCWRRLPW